jgi:multiple sugar transport system substrate-binding protein
MKTRLVGTVGAAAISAALVWGCGGDSDPGGGKVVLSYLRHDNPPYVTADDAYFADYTLAHPNVTVDSTTVKYQTLGTTLLADLKSDKLSADLVRVIPSWVCSFADNLLDVPADVVTLAEAQNTFFAAPLGGSTCDGRLKGLPIEYNLEYGGVVLNLDKYQAKFGATKTPAWGNWSDFIGEAAALSEYEGTTPKANGLDIAPDWPQPVKHIFFSEILQRGGTYWRADKTFDFSGTAAHESLADMIKWINTDKVMFPSLIPDKNTFVTTRLASGATGYGWSDPARPLSVMGYAGTWALPNTTGQIPAGKNVRYGFFALPPMVGSDHKFVQNSGFALVVPKTSKNPKAAWDLIKSLALSPAAMRKWAATAGTLPALKVNGTPEAAMADPLLAKVQPLLERGQWVGYIPAGAIETVEGALSSNFFDAVAGKKTLDKALADMEQAANAALSQNH